MPNISEHSGYFHAKQLIPAVSGNAPQHPHQEAQTVEALQAFNQPSHTNRTPGDTIDEFGAAPYDTSQYLSVPSGHAEDGPTELSSVARTIQMVMNRLTSIEDQLVTSLEPTSAARAPATTHTNLGIKHTMSADGRTLTSESTAAAQPTSRPSTPDNADSLIVDAHGMAAKTGSDLAYAMNGRNLAPEMALSSPVGPKPPTFQQIHPSGSTLPSGGLKHVPTALIMPTFAQSSVRLPEPNPFFGEYFDWPRFASEWTNFVNATMPDQFSLTALLKKLLKGNAETTAQRFDGHTSEDYDDLWQALVARFHRPDQVVKHYLNTFKEINAPTRETIPDLRLFHGETCVAVNKLRRAQRDVNNEFFTLTLQSKIQTPKLKMHLRQRQKETTRSGAEWHTTAILNAMEEFIQEMEELEADNREFGHSRNRHFRPPQRTFCILDGRRVRVRCDEEDVEWIDPHGNDNPSKQKPKTPRDPSPHKRNVHATFVEHQRKQLGKRSAPAHFGPIEQVKRRRPQTGPNGKRQREHCIFCRNPTHRSLDCKKYKTHTSRTKRLQTLNRCSYCTRVGHSLEDCYLRKRQLAITEETKANTCDYCKEIHNWLVCPTKFPGEKERPESPSTPGNDKADQCTHIAHRTNPVAQNKSSAPTTDDEFSDIEDTFTDCGTAESTDAETEGPPRQSYNFNIVAHRHPTEQAPTHTLLMTTHIPVISTNGQKTHEVVPAFFDQGSDQTYITKSLAEDLGLTLNRVFHSTIHTFMDREADGYQVEVWEVEFDLRLLDGSTIHVVAHATNDFAAPMPTIYGRSKAVAHIIENPELPVPVICTTPQILIGTDHLNEFDIIRRRKPLTNGFYVYDSRAGPLLNGRGATIQLFRFPEGHNAQRIFSVQNGLSDIPTHISLRASSAHRTPRDPPRGDILRSSNPETSQRTATRARHTQSSPQETATTNPLDTNTELPAVSGTQTCAHIQARTRYPAKRCQHVHSHAPTHISHTEINLRPWLAVRFQMPYKQASKQRDERRKGITAQNPSSPAARAQLRRAASAPHLPTLEHISRTLPTQTEPSIVAIGHTFADVAPLQDPDGKGSSRTKPTFSIYTAPDQNTSPQTAREGGIRTQSIPIPPSNLDNRSEQMIATSPTAPSGSPPRHFPRRQSRTTPIHTRAKASTNKCVFCTRPHRSSNCSTFPTRTSRRTQLQNLKRCEFCFRKKHAIKACYSHKQAVAAGTGTTRRCQHCQELHSHILCPIKYPDSPRPQQDGGERPAVSPISNECDVYIARIAGVWDVILREKTYYPEATTPTTSGVTTALYRAHKEGTVTNAFLAMRKPTVDSSTDERSDATATVPTPDDQPSPTISSPVANSLPVAQSQTSATRHTKCTHCTGPHRQTDCTYYPSADARDKRRKELRLCCRCFHPHDSRKCTMKLDNCTGCGKRHHEALCRTKFPHRATATSHKESQHAQLHRSQNSPSPTKTDHTPESPQQIRLAAHNEGNSTLTTTPAGTSPPAGNPRALMYPTFRCTLCKGAHSHVDCTTYITAVTRHQRRMELKLCYRCFRQHHSSLCKMKLNNCTFCDKLHNEALCWKRFPQRTRPIAIVNDKPAQTASQTEALSAHNANGCNAGARQRKCVFCSSKWHMSDNCREFPTWITRVNQLQSLQRCRFCHRKGHVIDTCHSHKQTMTTADNESERRCQHCLATHSDLLCPVKYPDSLWVIQNGFLPYPPDALAIELAQNYQDAHGSHRNRVRRHTLHPTFVNECPHEENRTDYGLQSKQAPHAQISLCHEEPIVTQDDPTRDEEHRDCESVAANASVPDSQSNTNHTATAFDHTRSCSTSDDDQPTPTDQPGPTDATSAANALPANKSEPTASRPYRCTLCKSAHSHVVCTTYVTALARDQRRKDLRLCCRCFRQHDSRKCKTNLGDCQFCGKQHHHALCRTKFPQRATSTPPTRPQARNPHYVAVERRPRTRKESQSTRSRSHQRKSASVDTSLSQKAHSPTSSSTELQSGRPMDPTSPKERSASTTPKPTLLTSIAQTSQHVSSANKRPSRSDIPRPCVVCQSPEHASFYCDKHVTYRSRKVTLLREARCHTCCEPAHGGTECTIWPQHPRDDNVHAHSNGFPNRRDETPTSSQSAAPIADITFQSNETSARTLPRSPQKTAHTNPLDTHTEHVAVTLSHIETTRRSHASRCPQVHSLKHMLDPQSCASPNSYVTGPSQMSTNKEKPACDEPRKPTSAQKTTAAARAQIPLAAVVIEQPTNNHKKPGTEQSSTSIADSFAQISVSYETAQPLAVDVQRVPSGPDHVDTSEWVVPTNQETAQNTPPRDNTQVRFSPSGQTDHDESSLHEDDELSETDNVGEDAEDGAKSNSRAVNGAHTLYYGNWIFDAHIHMMEHTGAYFNNAQTYAEWIQHFPKDMVFAGALNVLHDPALWGDANSDQTNSPISYVHNNYSHIMPTGKIIGVGVGCHPKFCDYDRYDKDTYSVERVEVDQDRIFNTKANPTFHGKIPLVVGECGLEHGVSRSEEGKPLEQPREVQIAMLKAHIRIAKKYQKPIMLHIRGKTYEQQQSLERHAIKIFEEMEWPQNLNIIRHSYTGGPEMAGEWLDRWEKTYFSFSLASRGFPDSIRFMDCFEPELKHIIIETDAPLLSRDVAGNECLRPNDPRRRPANSNDLLKVLQQLHDMRIDIYGTVEEVLKELGDNVFNAYELDHAHVIAALEADTTPTENPQDWKTVFPHAQAGVPRRHQRDNPQQRPQRRPRLDQPFRQAGRSGSSRRTAEERRAESGEHWRRAESPRRPNRAQIPRRDIPTRAPMTLRSLPQLPDAIRYTQREHISTEDARQALLIQVDNMSGEGLEMFRECREMHKSPRCNGTTVRDQFPSFEDHKLELMGLSPEEYDLALEVRDLEIPSFLHLVLLEWAVRIPRSANNRYRLVSQIVCRHVQEIMFLWEEYLVAHSGTQLHPLVREYIHAAVHKWSFCCKPLQDQFKKAKTVGPVHYLVRAPPDATDFIHDAVRFIAQNVPTGIDNNRVNRLAKGHQEPERTVINSTVLFVGDTNAAALASCCTIAGGQYVQLYRWNELHAFLDHAYFGHQVLAVIISIGRADLPHYHAQNGTSDFEQLVKNYLRQLLINFPHVTFYFLLPPYDHGQKELWREHVASAYNGTIGTS